MHYSRYWFPVYYYQHKGQHLMDAVDNNKLVFATTNPISEQKSRNPY